MNETPQGVVALFIGPDGRVVAHAADFDTSKAAGFDIHEAQTYRARQRLGHEACRQMMNHDAAEAMSAYQSDSLLREMVTKKGYRIELVAVGQSEDD